MNKKDEYKDTKKNTSNINNTDLQKVGLSSSSRE